MSLLPSSTFILLLPLISTLAIAGCSGKEQQSSLSARASHSGERMRMVTFQFDNLYQRVPEYQEAKSSSRLMAQVWMGKRERPIATQYIVDEFGNAQDGMGIIKDMATIFLPGRSRSRLMSEVSARSAVEGSNSRGGSARNGNEDGEKKSPSRKKSADAGSPPRASPPRGSNRESRRSGSPRAASRVSSSSSLDRSFNSVPSQVSTQKALWKSIIMFKQKTQNTDGHTDEEPQKVIIQVVESRGNLGRGDVRSLYCVELFKESNANQIPFWGPYAYPDRISMAIIIPQQLLGECPDYIKDYTYMDD